MKRLTDFIITIWAWFVVIIATVAATFPIAFCSIFLAPFDPQRKWAHQCGFYWGRSIMKSNPLWELKVNGLHNARPNQCYVIVSNHSSLADIVCLYNLGLQFKWLAKTSLFKIPFLGWSMALMKYIPLERGHRGSIRTSYEQARRWLEQDMSVLFFPEGTRSRDGSLGEFRNGAFKLAIETETPILPIALAGSRQAIAKGKMTVGSSLQVSMTVLPSMDTKKYETKDFAKLKNEVRFLISKELEKIRSSSPHESKN